MLVQPYERTMLELCDVLPVNSPSFDINCDSCREPGTLPTEGNTVASGCTIQDVDSKRFVLDGGNGTIGMSDWSQGESGQFDFIAAGQF